MLIFGDTWEDFFALPISESNRRQSQWAIHYIIQDGVSYVAAAGKGADQAMNLSTCNFLLYSGERIKVKEEIKADTIYQLDYLEQRIKWWFIEDGNGPWELID